jgi:phage terminase large subunit-like protein
MNTLSVHLTNNLAARGLSMITGELKPMGRGKKERILQFTPYNQNKLIHINKGCNEIFLEEFLNEWSRFPKSKRDDCLDASAYIFDYLAKYPLELYGNNDITLKKIYCHNKETNSPIYNNSPDGWLGS